MPPPESRRYAHHRDRRHDTRSHFAAVAMSVGWFAGLPEDVWRQHVWPALFTPCRRMRTQSDADTRHTKLMDETLFRRPPDMTTEEYKSLCRCLVDAERRNTTAWHRTFGVCGRCVWPTTEDFADVVVPRKHYNPWYRVQEELVQTVRCDLRTACAVARTCHKFHAYTRAYTPLWMRAYVLREFVAQHVKSDVGVGTTPGHRSWMVFATCEQWWLAFGLSSFITIDNGSLHEHIMDIRDVDGICRRDLRLEVAATLWRHATTRCAEGAYRLAVLMCASGPRVVPGRDLATAPSIDAAGLRATVQLLRAVHGVDAHRAVEQSEVPMLVAYRDGEDVDLVDPHAAHDEDAFCVVTQPGVSTFLSYRDDEFADLVDPHAVTFVPYLVAAGRDTLRQWIAQFARVSCATTMDDLARRIELVVRTDAVSTPPRVKHACV